MPASITADTDFYLKNAGSYRCSATIDGLEYGPGVIDVASGSVSSVPVATDRRSTEQIVAAERTAAAATYPSKAALAIYPVGDYASIAAAIAACSAGGGGFVRLRLGANPVSATLAMASRVVLAGPDMEWSVWGYNSDPRPFHSCWLEADGTAGAVVDFGATVVNASLRNVLVMANGRRGVNIASSTNRGGNRLRNVAVNNGDVYIGQPETRVQSLRVMLAPADGVTIDASDCEMAGSILVGFSGGNGLVATALSGPLRGDTIDSFNNALAGVVLDGDGHRLAKVESNNNGRQGIIFRSCTSAQIVQVGALDNGREYTGSGGFTTRYPDVDFAHPTAGNAGCGILGGKISSSDAKQSYAIKNSETVATFPLLQGISFAGAYPGGTSPFAYLSSLSSFNTRGCNLVPDMVMPQAGVAAQHRPNGTADQEQWTDGSGGVYAGVTAAGLFYAPSLKATGLPGAVNPGRFVGVTTTGPPTSGTFLVSDYVLTQNGQMFVCVTAGTPGAWVAPRDTTDLLSVGEETFSRRHVARTDVTITSGRMILSYFTARKSETTTKVRTMSGTNAAAATPTLCRVGLYSIDGAGAGTLVAAVANDTTLWATSNTAYTSNLSASIAKTAGQRYAIGHLVVSATTMPNWLTGQVDSNGLRAEDAIAPRLNGYVGAQSDLPGSFTDAGVTGFSSPIYSALLP